MSANESASKRVLCVDDDPRILEGLSWVLKGKFDVTTCLSGAEGLEELEKHGPFNAIISDMQMPVMNGAEFLRRARAIAPDTARILLTGQASIESAVSAVNEGHIFRFLTKPCPPKDLQQSLNEAIQDRHEAALERDQLDKKLQELSQQLLRADRLASLGSFAGALGHELNNIMTVCVGTIQLMEEQDRQGLAPNPDNLRTLGRVGRHLKDHAAGLLHWTRLHPATTKEIDVRLVVKDTLYALRSAGKTRHIDVGSILPDKPALIRANYVQIEQVFINLIGNAVDAILETPGQAGKVRIRVENDVERSRVICRVEDTGCGIPAERLEEIFQPYFTTKPLDRGTGLGLAIVKQIVSSHRGELSVESRPGEGTVFTLAFPNLERK